MALIGYAALITTIASRCPSRKDFEYEAVRARAGTFVMQNGVSKFEFIDSVQVIQKCYEDRRAEIDGLKRTIAELESKQIPEQIYGPVESVPMRAK